MRKVLSFVLVLSLVLGSFSMAFADTPASGLSDIAGIANEEAIQVNFDLGIVTGNPDGTFLPEKAVNRAEFAAMITRALAIPDSALAGYSTTSFKDTAGYGWAVPYLAFCNSKGIMLGDGAGNAMPGRTINTNEAITMALRAVGYVANSAELVGVWPANYVTKAQELGLYDDVAKVTSVDKANAAQIIYNTLTVQKVAVNSDGETVYLWDDKAKTEPTTLLSAGLNCTSKDGVMGADFGDDAVINVQKYIGQYGTAYLNKDKEVVAFISDCTQLVGTYLATTGWDANFNTTDADVDYTNNTTTTGIDFFVNGEYDNSPAGSPTLGTEYVLYADVSGKKINAVYSVVKWDVTADDKVSAADLKDIADDQSLLGEEFILDDDDEIDYSSFALVGVASLDKIAEDDIVYVYSDSEGIRKIEVGTATVEGDVKDFKAVDKEFKVGTTKLKNAATILNGLDNYTNVTDSEVGDTVKVYLDARGYVYTLDNIENAANNVAFVEAKSNTGLAYEARVTLADGSSKVLEAKNSSVFGQLNNKSLFSYGLNSDGKIASVEGATRAGIANIVTFASTTLVRGISGSSIIAKDVVVFTHNTAEDDFDVTTMDKVNMNEAITHDVQALFNKDGDKIIALYIHEDDASASSDDVYGVINDVYKTNNDADDVVNRVEGFAGTSKIDKLTDAVGYFATGIDPTYTSNAAIFGASVALYKIEMDANGVIVDATEVVDNNDDVATVGALLVTAADGRNSVTLSDTETYALAADVVVYEVNEDGDYKIYTGSFKANDVVVLYNIDADDNDQYDYVLLCREGR